MNPHEDHDPRCTEPRWVLEIMVLLAGLAGADAELQVGLKDFPRSTLAAVVPILGAGDDGVD